MEKYQTCDYCEGPIIDDTQEALVKGDRGYLTVHKDCAMRVFRGLWDEYLSRTYKGLDPYVPYTDETIVNPVVRKAIAERNQEALDEDTMPSGEYRAKVEANKVLVKALLFDRLRESENE